MKYFHYARFRIISSTKEDALYQAESILDLFSQDFKKDTSAFLIEHISQESDDPLVTHVVIKKHKYLVYLCKYIYDCLSVQDRQELVQTIQERIDDQGMFYVRLEKENFPKICTLTQRGNCIHIAIKIAAYPKTKQNAVKTCIEFFKTLEQ